MVGDPIDAVNPQTVSQKLGKAARLAVILKIDITYHFSGVNLRARRNS